MIIETENLTRKFGDLTVVNNITLRINQGEIFGFLGPNGAGKTTTIRMLACLISKTSGTAKIADFEVGNSADRKMIRSMIGLLPENVGLYETMSAYKNLDFYGRFYKVPEAKRKERIEYLLKILGLWEKRELVSGTFSKGMKQKLAIARALIHDPAVLFLDEPTANLDPEASKIVRNFIVALKKENKTIFLNTHMLDEANKICDRVGIMKAKLIAVGTPKELRESLFAKTTIVQLETISEAIVSAVRKLGAGKVEVANGNKLIISVKDSNKENPDIVHAIDVAGGRIRSVSLSNPALEDVYLKLIGSKE